MTRVLLALIATIVLVVPAAAQEKSRAVTAKHGMVVCVSPEAANVGVAVLKQGRQCRRCCRRRRFCDGGDLPGRGQHWRRRLHARLPAGQGADCFRVSRNGAGGGRQEHIRENNRLARSQGGRCSGYRARPGTGPQEVRQTALEGSARCRPCNWRKRASPSTGRRLVAECRRCDAREAARNSTASSARTAASRPGSPAIDSCKRIWR